MPAVSTDGARVIGIDPDQATMGVAVAEVRRRALVAVHLVEAPPVPAARCPLCPAACPHAATDAAGLLLYVGAVLGPLAPRPGDVLAVEGQFIQRHGRLDPGPLLDLAWLAGALAARMAAAGARVLRVPPRSWRGTEPKPVVQARILASLTAAERDLLPRGPRTERYQGDALDAAGLVLWSLGRLGELHADPADFAQLVDPKRSPRLHPRAAARLAQTALALWQTDGPPHAPRPRSLRTRKPR